MTKWITALAVLIIFCFADYANAQKHHPIYSICNSVACEQHLEKLEKQGKLRSKSCPMIEWHPDLGPWIPCVMAFPEGPGRLGPDGSHPRTRR